jgi:hypothetical protein
MEDLLFSVKHSYRYWLALICLGGVMGGGTVWAKIPLSLYVEAMERGSVRVIVHLRVESVSEEQAGGAERRREAIVQAREALLRELASTSFRVTRVYDTIPFVALEIWPDAWRVLERSVLVVEVEEDKLSSPQ